MQDVERTLSQEPVELAGGYTDRDSLLYAVAIGMGRDPLDAQELEYVCETMGDRVVPTAATVLSSTNEPAPVDADHIMLKMNFALMLHGEQRLQIHNPLPPAAETLVSNRTTGVYDKGADKGALLTSETAVKLADGSPLYTLGTTMFFRGDGGFGGTSDGAPVPHTLPERKPDAICEMPGRRDQAMIYALCGDRNPLHRDPGIAKQAGFDIPILHGLCSYGMACHAVLKTMLDYDQTRMKGFDVRFSAPVLPGETQVVEMWQDDNVISFRVRLKERDLICINNGKCTIG
ncbi:MAG: 3-alpha,7-alpha,12-alpha-trihydroxy-5-beta-cholest-24-enoyl-CoA hydratase [Gammaproteobacteria bacterium]|nr:3-alpha,7-alpha,12-alpha-trihydroxy-5-beta-cholest-24-enoyl-CoA hydratase [Gammaproteobacteria bacterium]